MNRVSAPVAPPSRTTAPTLTASKCSSNFAWSRPPSASPNSLDYGFQSHSITASKCISKLARSQPPSASPNLLDYSLQSRSITASKCISKLTWLRPPISLDHGLQVHLQTRSITASKYIFNERRRVYRDTGVTEVERVTGSRYSADPGVDRHLISILSYHTMKIHYLSQPFGLTHSVRDIMDPCNCVWASTPGNIISSHPIPTLLEPELLFRMNSLWMSWEVRRSVEGGLSAF